MDDTELARGRRSSCRMALPARSKRTANATRRRPPDGETLLLAGSLLPAITPPRTALAIRQGTRRAGAKRRRREAPCRRAERKGYAAW